MRTGRGTECKKSCAFNHAYPRFNRDTYYRSFRRSRGNNIPIICDKENHTCPLSIETLIGLSGGQYAAFGCLKQQYSYDSDIEFTHVLVLIEALTGYGPVALPLS